MRAKPDPTGKQPKVVISQGVNRSTHSPPSALITAMSTVHRLNPVESKDKRIVCLLSHTAKLKRNVSVR